MRRKGLSKLKNRTNFQSKGDFLSKKKLLPNVKEMREKFYKSGIGPDSDAEASAIHKGVYDGISIWRPDKFVKHLLKVKRGNFDEFEANEKHYYYGVFVSVFLLKYVGVITALKVFPLITSYL